MESMDYLRIGNVFIVHTILDDLDVLHEKLLFEEELFE